MTPSVCIQRTKQAPPFDYVTNALKAALRSFFVAEEHRVVLIGGIIHGDDQIPVLPRYPQVRAAVLMQHHPRPG